MPTLVSFIPEQRFMKPSALRLQLRSFTRKGKKLCWDTVVKGQDIYRSKIYQFIPGSTPILMWFTGNDSELLMFKLTLQGVKMDVAKSLSDDEFRSVQLQLDDALSKIRESKKNMNLYRWNYSRYIVPNAEYKKQCRRIAKIYQDVLQQVQLTDKYVEEGVL